MSRTFNVKARPFSRGKIRNMYRYYYIPVLNKSPNYIKLHVSTNDAVITEASVIVDKLLQLKCFVKEKLPNCKTDII